MTGTRRQLAVIMFSDIAGYTALMQKNESLAKTIRDKYRQATETLVPSHHGNVIQFYGDGSLSIFNSALDAVNCAVKIQKEMLHEPKVDLRIGLHTGDV